jgi:hypothetical protein
MMAQMLCDGISMTIRGEMCEMNVQPCQKICSADYIVLSKQFPLKNWSDLCSIRKRIFIYKFADDGKQERLQKAGFGVKNI